MKKLTLLAALFSGITALHAADGKVLAEVKSAEGETPRAIAWYNISEPPAPVKSRDIAQTFKATADGKLQKLVIPLDTLSAASRPATGVTNFAFTVTVYDHGQQVPTGRFIKGNATPEPGKAELSADGNTFTIHLGAPADLLAGNYYTVALGWSGAAPDNKISLPQAKGNAENFRWHRDNRGSWVQSPDSLVFTALGK